MKNNRLMRPGFMLGLLFLGSFSYGQVGWSFSAERKGDTVVEVHLKASLSDGWHLYSSDSSASPFPTKINIEQKAGVRLKGALRERGRLITGEAGDVRYFIGEAEFVQVLICDRDLHHAKGTVEFVTCTDERCMAPVKKEFSVRL